MILIVIPWSPHLAGGVSTVVRSLHAALRAADTAGRIVVSDWNFPAPSDGADGEVHFRMSVLSDLSLTSLLKATLSGPATLMRMHRFVRLTRAAVVNLHYPNASDLLGFALLKEMRMWRGRLVVSFHGTDVTLPRTPAQLALWRFGLARADRITACSQSLAGAAESVFGLAPARVETVYNGVDHVIFRPDAAHRPIDVGPLPEQYIVSVGSYIARKGHSFLLEAFGRLVTKWPHLHLVIAGMDGPELSALLARGREAGLDSRLHCLTDLNPVDVATVMARAAFCVQPSLAEPFGLAVVEAAACGVPVLVSAVGGHLEIVEDGVSGRVFASASASACAAAIDATLSDPQTARRMASTLQQIVRSRFDWTATARALYGE